MQAFWTNGYEATSMADLMAATGLHKGSLYQAFGDKHSLFIQALKRYLEGLRRDKSRSIAAGATPLEGIRGVAHGMIDMADNGSSCPRGCMAVNTLVELAPHDAEVQQVLGEHVTHMRASLEQAMGDAQAAGEISADRSPELCASLMMTFMAGLATNLKGPLGTADAHALLDAYLETLR